MKKFAIHLFLIAAMCVALSNCRKDPETLPPPTPPCAYPYDANEMKKWYYFKVGSQWIYEEQNSGALDTARVYSNADGVDWFDAYEYHSYGGWQVHYWIGDNLLFPCKTTTQCSCIKIQRSRFKPGNFVGESSAFTFPHIVGNWNYDSGSGHQVNNTVISVQDSVVLNDITYYEVVHWNLPADATENDSQWRTCHTNYWIAKNVGVIRQVNYDKDTDWQLIDYHIVQ